MKKTLTIVLLLCVLISPAMGEKASVAPENKETKETMVSFNFVDVDLTAVTKFVSDITGKNFVFDERLRGKVTIIAPSKLNIGDAFNLFTTVLRLKGFTLVPSGVDIYKIIPAAEARQSGMEMATDVPAVSDKYIARLIPLKFISAEDAMRFIQPVVSRDGHISTFGPGNLLFVVDSGINIQRILSMIEAIDQMTTGEEPDIVMLQYSSSDAVARMLNEGLVRPGRQAKAVSEPRLNAVVLFGDRGIKEAMKRLIALIDVPAAKEQGAINVYFLENADAEELSKVLEGLIRGQPGKPQASLLASMSGVIITPDKATNSLVIVASPSAYQGVIQVIKQLDRKRRQVYVEAMIVEASPSKLRELGTKWRAGGEVNDSSIAVGGVGRIDQTALLDLVSGLSGQLTLGGVGDFLTVPITTPTGTTTNLTIPGFAALFNLKDFRGAVNVLSTPQILTSDNKQAEIIVGENVPFIGKIERGLTPGEQVPFSSIERRDVGITLRITPQITEGDYVKLEIYQEISSVKKPQVALEEVLATTVGPTTTKRSTKTTVVVKDEQPVVIGGLMQEKQETNVNKVPILGDIPILGWLFKTKSTSHEKTNLLVFLTPHIVRDAEDLVRLTEEKEREFGRNEKTFAEGEILVKFKPDVSEESAGALIAEKGATVIKSAGGIYHIKLREGQGVKSGVNEFKEIPEVEYAEPNYVIKGK